MSIQLTIDKAGRVVIPKALRDELHLEPGDTLEMDSVGEQITLRPVSATGFFVEEHGIQVFYSGEPLSASTTDDLLTLIRNERDLSNVSGGE